MPQAWSSASPRLLPVALAVVGVVWWLGLALAGLAALSLLAAALGLASPRLPLVVPVSLDLGDGAVAVAAVTSQDTAGAVDPTRPDGTVVGELGRAEARLRLSEVDLTTLALQTVLLEVYAAGALWGLHLVRSLTRSVAAGRPFTPRNAGRLRLLAALVVAVTVLEQLVRALLQAHLASRLDLTGARFTSTVTWPVVAAVTAVGLLAVAEAFRHGSALQDDTDRTV